MLELGPALRPALDAGEAVAVVTVTRVARSAPRGPGAAMAVRADGSVIGSISGGCVEGDAVMLATAVLAGGRATAATFGFSDESAHAAGLACGGSVEVIVHRVGADDDVARRAWERPADRRARVGIVVNGPEAGRLIADEDLPAAARQSGMLDGAYDGADVFAVVRSPQPRLVIVGAGEHAMALSRIAAAAGFTVVVCDVWERLVTAERFPDAHRLVVGSAADEMAGLVGEEPENTAVCVLSHDERVDVPALAAALRRGAGFVGAMGARATVAARARLLADAGLGAEDIARLHSPLGLDLGGSSPEATALSVLAEITAARHGGSGLPLRSGSGPLHRRVGNMSQEACDLASVSWTG